MDDKRDLDLNESIKTHVSRMTSTDWRDQALHDYYKCIVCGSDLEFTHVTHFTHLSVEEDVHCGQCKMQAKRITHSLQ